MVKTSTIQETSQDNMQVLDNLRQAAYNRQESEVLYLEHYVPPFSITNQMLTLVAQIAEKTGRVTGYRSFETKPHLRRNNRIRSIHPWPSKLICYLWTR